MACSGCTTGVIHEGEATGTFETIGGIKTYVALPKGEFDKTKALIFLPDIYGFELINSRLLADSYAAAGIPVYFPDLYQGDAVPPERMNQPGFNLMKDWIPNHQADKVRPPIDAVIGELKSKGVTTFAATGYCFGARYVVDLLVEKVASIGVVAHPSFLVVPKDLEDLKNAGLPILFNTCETDGAFPAESQKLADEILGGEKGYKRTYWAGCSHGFAVRGNLDDPLVKKGKEGAFDASAEFIKAHL